MHLWDVHYLAHMVFSKGAQYPVSISEFAAQKSGGNHFQVILNDAGHRAGRIPGLAQFLIQLSTDQ
jgi:hypothetical protein